MSSTSTTKEPIPCSTTAVLVAHPVNDFPRFWGGLAGDLLMALRIVPVVDHLGMRFTLEF